MPTRITPVFVDCDNTMGLPGQEIDDGLTLLYLLARSSVAVVGVSATHGNGTVAAASRQTRALLSSLGERIPVYDGADPPARDVPDPATDRSASSLSDPSVPARPTWRSRSEAAAALVRASREYAGRLVVLGLGALTNVAGAAELDAGFYERLAGVRIMGGYLGPLRFPRREVSELNLSSDPGAAYSVLRAPSPVTVMSAQLCLGARFGPWDLVAHNRGPRWLRAVVRDWYHAFANATGSRGFYLWDLLPAVSVTEPSRFPSRVCALDSSVDDLAVGRLVLARAGPGDTGASAAGLVDVPARIVSPRRLVVECAAGWARTARRVTSPRYTLEP